MKNGQYEVAEAAKILGVVPETVRRYIREGKLRAKKMRLHGEKKGWGIAPGDLEEFKNR